MALPEVSAAVQAARDSGAVAALCWQCNKVFAVSATSDELVEARREHADQHPFPASITLIAARAVNPFKLEAYYQSELVKQIQRENDSRK